jgi:hypothetical protein
MSGLREETMATFEVAMKQAQTDMGIGNALLDVIEASFIKYKPREEDRTGIPELHQELQDDIEEFFERDPNVKKYFVYEAMSGKGKFGKSNWAMADHIMVFSPKGSCKKYQTITLGYAAKIANQVKLNVTLKTQGKNTSTALRLNIKEDKETIWDLYEQEKQNLNELALFDWFKNFAQKVINKVKSLINKGIGAVMEFLGLSWTVSATNTVVF